MKLAIRQAPMRQQIEQRIINDSVQYNNNFHIIFIVADILILSLNTISVINELKSIRKQKVSIIIQLMCS